MKYFDTGGIVPICINAIMLNNSFISVGLTNCSNNAVYNDSISITIAYLKNNI